VRTPATTQHQQQQQQQQQRQRQQQGCRRSSAVTPAGLSNVRRPTAGSHFHRRFAGARTILPRTRHQGKNSILITCGN